MFRCTICGRMSFTESEAGSHMRAHGVNLFPEVLRLTGIIHKIEEDNRRLTKENLELKSRLRIVIP